MTPFPLPLAEMFGHWGSYVVYLFIGLAFGAVLELSGFGNSRKLAAQFYFKDLTVLKVMFTAIIVAMVLLFGASALGLMDYNLLWVNPTYLWPGIVGGLIMGVGFVIGGFCPGTSLVAAATLKKDGIFFVLGVLTGIFLFGETVQYFAGFWNSSYMGRYTLPEMFGLPTGVVVLGVVLMALFMFWAGEKLEAKYGEPDAKPAPKWRYGSGGRFPGGCGCIAHRPTHHCGT
ncbi:MAG TPA: sulfurtransferase, partial [Anaerolineae bacterium]|nr:sulfurtransferase [Anaerolineae bacterium]